MPPQLKARHRRAAERATNSADATVDVSTQAPMVYRAQCFAGARGNLSHPDEAIQPTDLNEANHYRVLDRRSRSRRRE
jgi:hypothetical protein